MPRNSTIPDRDLANREAITDAVCSVMQSHYRSTTIDTLLCRPHEAIRFATMVCKSVGIKAGEDNINHVCRVALGARKRGDLKK